MLATADDSALTGCSEALTPAELDAHFEVRRRVFVEEQRIFTGSDQDMIDARVTTIHLVGRAAGAVVAAVRLYPLDLAGSRWKGDRLAVLPEHRSATLGADLVRLAVRTACREGGGVMEAMIQLPNVRYFERLGWVKDGGVVPYAGHAHQPMVIDLWFDALAGGSAQSGTVSGAGSPGTP